MSPSETQLRMMIDTIPALAWSCLPDGANEFTNKPWRDYTGRGSRVGMATDISSGRSRKGRGELASRSAFRRTERGGSSHAAVRRRVSLVPDSCRAGSRPAWQHRQMVRNEYRYRGTEASREGASRPR